MAAASSPTGRYPLRLLLVVVVVVVAVAQWGRKGMRTEKRRVEICLATAGHA